ncbi:restriction endonuclease [Halobacillus campisalis]|uniref:Restriction endonuclease n=1 Tax=Halobacillus campisalis TaxID=435909 RepID=A0ABW2K4G9_9BACI|nr:restriction endonuclease [Halobacillus campisalis]
MGRRRRTSFGYLPILLAITLFIYVTILIEKFFYWLMSLSPLTWLTMIFAIIVFVTLFRNHRIKKKIIEEELIAHERKIVLKRKGNLIDLKKMLPLEFEYFICDLFLQMGYEAEVTKATGDGGKDIVLRKGDYCAIVECKRYDKTKVTRPKIQQFHSAVIDCKAEIGFFITTGEYTLQARKYVLDKPIDLINGSQLVKLIEKVTEKQCTAENFGLVLKKI